jgi:hypothetical protein
LQNSNAPPCQKSGDLVAISLIQILKIEFCECKLKRGEGDRAFLLVILMQRLGLEIKV